jgi:hypothetical protein
MRPFDKATRKPSNNTSRDGSFRQIPYIPNVRAHAPRISKDEWQKHEARIRELHKEGCTSERARQILRDESQDISGCFNPSAAQYTAHLKALGLKKYNPKRRHGGLHERDSYNDLRDEDILSDDKAVTDKYHHLRVRRNALSKFTFFLTDICVSATWT